MELRVVTNEAAPPQQRRVPDQGPTPRAITLKRAVQYTDHSRTTLYRLAGEGEIVFIKAGRTTLLDLASWDAYLARQPRAVIRVAPRKGRAA